jgi:hypothetical protein
MRTNILLLVVALCLGRFASAQGKYAPTLKNLIGKSFADERKVAGLKGYAFTEGTMITPINDPQRMAVDVYRKGNQAVVLFSLLTDSVKMISTILDVIEIKNILKGWDIKVATCSLNGNEQADVVALAKTGTKEYTTTVSKAWRCNRDKIRIEAISAKGLKCLNEGMEQY